MGRQGWKYFDPVVVSLVGWYRTSLLSNTLWRHIEQPWKRKEWTSGQEEWTATFGICPLRRRERRMARCDLMQLCGQCRSSLL
ncbi:hypothetical protein RB213_006628 [Colletotrichum asianum]